MNLISKKSVEVFDKENRIYLLSYISEFVLSIFLYSMIFAPVVFLPDMLPKGIVVFLASFILVSLLIRMASFGVQKYNKAYIKSFYQLIDKNHRKSFIIQLIIAFILCFALRFLT